MNKLPLFPPDFTSANMAYHLSIMPLVMFDTSAIQTEKVDRDQYVTHLNVLGIVNWNYNILLDIIDKYYWNLTLRVFF